MNGLERVEPMYAADRFRRDQVVYRYSNNGIRYYCTAEPEIQWFPSVTSITSRTLPMPDGMRRLLGDLGEKEYREFMAEKAAYGTWMHLLWGNALINRIVDVSYGHISDELDRYRLTCEIPVSTALSEIWIERAQHDLLSLAQWARDVQVNPLAIEMVLVHPSLGYGGCVDLVCDMTIEEKGFFGEYFKTGPRAGEPKESKREKRVRAIVDFKSGRSGFYDDHAVQLEAYRMLWNASYPDFPVEVTYNLGPNDWRTAPGYNFKQQESARFPLLLELFAVSCPRCPGSRREIDGKIALGEPVDGLIHDITPEEDIVTRTRQKKSA